MRILHVVPSLGGRDGGSRDAAIGYATALAEAGIAVSLVATHGRSARMSGRDPGQLTDTNGIPTRLFARRDEAFKYSAPLARWLRGHVREADLVHVHAVFSHASLAAGRVCTAAGIPYLVRPLGSLGQWALAHHHWRKWLFLKTAAGSLIRRSAALHFTSDRECLEAEPITGPHPCRVVPLGINAADLDRPVPAMGERERLVVALARWHPVKNLESLIEAFHRTGADGELARWRLTIAGSGEAVVGTELGRRARAGAAAGRISLAGWVDEPAKRALLDRASLLAMPSYQENFGLAALEAMACGVPVIVSDRVGLATTIDRAGAGWITGTDPDSVARALQEAARDADERSRRGTAARRLAARYRWDAVANALATWYQDILGRQEGRRN